MKFLVLFAVLVLRQNVLSVTVLDVLGKNGNNIITSFKNFTFEEYDRYLDGLLRLESIPANQTLDFPQSLSSSSYTLTEGKVARFYDPISLYGSFDQILFHQLAKEFYGITQVYGPKVDFNFKYTTRFQGSEKSGNLSLVVSHVPFELQIDLGDQRGETCIVDTSENDVFYFYDDKLTLVPKFDDDSDQSAGKDLVRQLSETWLGKLYRIIMKVKVENIAEDTKQKILHDTEFQKELNHICTKIQ